MFIYQMSVARPIRALEVAPPELKSSRSGEGYERLQEQRASLIIPYPDQLPS